MVFYRKRLVRLRCFRLYWKYGWIMSLCETRKPDLKKWKEWRQEQSQPSIVFCYLCFLSLDTSEPILPRRLNLTSFCKYLPESIHATPVQRNSCGADVASVLVWHHHTFPEQFEWTMLSCALSFGPCLGEVVPLDLSWPHWHSSSPLNDCCMFSNRMKG